MNETPAPEAALASGTPSSSLISMTLLVYALFGIAAVASFVSSGLVAGWPLVGVLGIVGLIIAYIKRDEAAGTWVASHLRWLIRTFWFWFLWNVIGVIILITLGLVLVGIPIAIAVWIAASIWLLYRLLRGYMLFKGSKAIPGM